MRNPNAGAVRLAALEARVTGCWTRRLSRAKSTIPVPRHSVWLGSEKKKNGLDKSCVVWLSQTQKAKMRLSNSAPMEALEGTRVVWLDFWFDVSPTSSFPSGTTFSSTKERDANVWRTLSVPGQPLNPKSWFPAHVRTVARMGWRAFGSSSSFSLSMAVKASRLAAACMK